MTAIAPIALKTSAGVRSGAAALPPLPLPVSGVLPDGLTSDGAAEVAEAETLEEVEPLAEDEPLAPTGSLDAGVAAVEDAAVVTSIMPETPAAAAQTSGPTAFSAAPSSGLLATIHV